MAKISNVQSDHDIGEASMTELVLSRMLNLI